MQRFLKSGWWECLKGPTFAKMLSARVSVCSTSDEMSGRFYNRVVITVILGSKFSIAVKFFLYF